MKGAFVSVFLILSLCGAPAGAVRASLSPITRVVDLLKELSAKVVSEGKVEEELYNKFVCWGKGIITSKTASNEEANGKISSLEAYIADLDAGAVELTTERTDLEKEIESLNADIAAADTMRGNEASEFATAKDEMEKAITALNKAIEVLGTATQDNTGGVLLSFESGVAEGFAARTKDGEALQQAVELGKKFLTKGDALFLRRLLTNDVPDADWKKLNRKATFKMSYKARSFKIQDVLAQLKSTFVENLSTATEKENTAQSEYNTLKSAKNSQLQTAQTGYQNMAGENGARGLSRSDTQAEIGRLQTQARNDERFISQTTASLAAKNTEWKDRQDLRAGETAAIAKAIEILHSDDARDNFKKSFKSQGYFFLQTNSETSARQRAANTAAATLRETARTTHDSRLVELADQVQFPTFGPAPAPAPAPQTAAGDRSMFANVLLSIDSMVSILRNEMDNDLTEKETCEKERAEDARTAILAARDIDEKTDHITKLEGEVADLEKSIKQAQDELQAERDEIAEALGIRNDENAEYVKADAEDVLARDTVSNAHDVLQKFYADNGLMFSQVAKKQSTKKQGPGEAPPPPPSTWEDPSYGGKTGEATGILSILVMVKEDIIKDIRKAKAEEDESQTAYNAQRAAFDSAESALQSSITTMDGTRASKVTEIGSTKNLRGTKKGELDSAEQTLQDNLDMGCEFMTIHYEARYKNRQFEIDGLQKAKAILQGASFR